MADLIHQKNKTKHFDLLIEKYRTSEKMVKNAQKMGLKLFEY